MQPAGSTYICVEASKSGFVRLGMDAIGGADFDAERIFNARIGNDVSHDESVSWNERFRIAQE